MRLRILGCGTSSGVPRLGGGWGACDPAEPRNRRTRVSILVSHEGTNILVDTGPDMRQQLLDAGVERIDAVIWTHDHADHCHGIDDLRPLFHVRRTPIAGYARRDTLDSLKSRFSYIFAGEYGYPTIVEGHAMPDRFQIGTIDVAVVDQPHGPITSAGLRFHARGRTIAYATDMSAMTEPMARLYRGVDLWVVDALRRRPHPSHASLEAVLGWVPDIGAGRTILTHMDSSMDYRGLLAELPAGVEPAYDGMEIAL